MSEPDIKQSSLYNEDLAPVPMSERTWGFWHLASLWVGMAVCIPTYMLAAGLISSGMNWWQALLTVSAGNMLVLIPMILNAHAGTKYGIPFPVLLRSSFGTIGSNVPSVMRALVACGWFGIQTWIGGNAIYTLHSVIFGFAPATASEMIPIIGLSPGQLACFLLFWAINMSVILAGINSIKWLETLAAPFLLLIGLGLLVWGVRTAGGFSVIFSEETTAILRGNLDSEFDFWKVFFPSLTAMVGFWATLSLNIPDFSRYVKSQRDQVLGQVIGLETTMTFYCFVGIAVTFATVVIFGEAIWDPVALIGRFESKMLVGFSLFCLIIATLSTNIAANVVSPANVFSNIAPRRISFKVGASITGFIGIAIFPWKLVGDFGAYIFTWLIGYGALLGAIIGVMLADYFIIRATRLDVRELYKADGIYNYGGAKYNWRAMVALALGVIPNIPGFLNAASNGAIQVPDACVTIYHYALFVSLFIAAFTHVALTRIFPFNVPACDTERTEF